MYLNPTENKVLIRNVASGKVLQIDKNTDSMVIEADYNENSADQLWTKEDSADETHFTLKIEKDYLTAFDTSFEVRQRTPLYCK